MNVVFDTKFVSATNVARGGKGRNICVGNNVSSFARAFTNEQWSLQTLYQEPLGVIVEWSIAAGYTVMT